MRTRLTVYKKVSLVRRDCNPLAEQIEQFENAVGQLPNIDEAVKKSLTTTLSAEAQIIQGREDDKSQVQKLLKTNFLQAKHF